VVCCTVTWFMRLNPGPVNAGVMSMHHVNKSTQLSSDDTRPSCPGGPQCLRPGSTATGLLRACGGLKAAGRVLKQQLLLHPVPSQPCAGGTAGALSTPSLCSHALCRHGILVFLGDCAMALCAMAC
jgi:hypothetical protein